MYSTEKKSYRFLIYVLLAVVLLVIGLSWRTAPQKPVAMNGNKPDVSHASDTLRRIVIFDEGFGAVDQTALVDRLGGSIIKEIPFMNAAVISVPAGNIEILQHSTGVKSVDEDTDIYAAPPQSDALPPQGHAAPPLKDIAPPLKDEACFSISAQEQEEKPDQDLFVTSGKTAINVTRHVALGRVERGNASKSGKVTILNTGDTPVTLGLKGQNAVGTGPLEGHQLRLVNTAPRGDSQYQAEFKIAGLPKPVILEGETKTVLRSDQEGLLIPQGSLLRAELQVNIPSGAPAGMYTTSVTVVAGASPESGESAQTIPWGVERIGAPEAWKRSQGEDVKVAVIDTGIAKDHPDLAVAGGYCVSALGLGSDDWNDAHGHGTHVAGIIAALDNDIGVVGVAPKAELYAVRVMDDSGRGNLSGILEGFQWAIENKIGVINISLTSDKPVPALEECIRAARAAGILTVVAGGNSGPEEDTLRYPAGYKEAIAVVATDANDTVADLSSRGDSLDLVAPGIEIRSTSMTGGYENQSGTSMAAAHVTGAVAVLLGSGMPVEAVYYYLTGTAMDLGYPETWQGAGLARLYIL